MSTEDPATIEPSGIDSAVEHLRNGRLVAFPTETVYGLGGDATSDLSVTRIFAAKERPRFNPLIIHLPDVAAVRNLVVFDDRAKRLADLFWPGALTLVLPRRPDCRVSLLASAGLDSLAVRIPAHPLAQQLLRAVGRPIAAPSANRSGRVSPTTAAHVRDELADRVSLILDGGPCRVGLESTVLDLTGEMACLLRPGGLAQAAIEAAIGPVMRAQPIADGAVRLGPGMMTSHYAPGLPVRLEATDARPGEAFLAFGAPPAGIVPALQLSVDGDPVEAAQHLFAALRALDRPEFTGIAIMPIPEDGLGAAINDRLRRAAAPR
ncbi:MAG: threonylcarbamoyl-AMP synthase [Rhodospirillales bacterium]|nr:threonylcarbamoyl-AMP synthase [Rhodospirillales bacterium]